MVEAEIQESKKQVLAYGKPMRRYILKTCKNLTVKVIETKDRHDEDVWQVVNRAGNQGTEILRTKVKLLFASITFTTKGKERLPHLDYM